MEKKYICIKDLENGDFALGFSMTIEEWKAQAMEWAENDGDNETYNELEKINETEILDYIQEVWNLKIVESCDLIENILFEINELIEEYRNTLNENKNENERILGIIKGLKNTRQIIYNELGGINNVKKL